MAQLTDMFVHSGNCGSSYTLSLLRPLTSAPEKPEEDTEDICSQSDGVVMPVGA